LFTDDCVGGELFAGAALAVKQDVESLGAPSSMNW